MCIFYIIQPFLLSFICFNHNDHRTLAHERTVLANILELIGDHTSWVIHENVIQEYFVYWYYQTASKIAHIDFVWTSPST